MQGEHQLAAQPLAQRQACDERLELADQSGVAPEREVGFDPVLQAGQVQLLQVRALGLGERLGELRQCGAAPQAQRFAQPRRGGGGFTRRERGRPSP
jgi:hypothetical protein